MANKTTRLFRMLFTKSLTESDLPLDMFFPKRPAQSALRLDMFLPKRPAQSALPLDVRRGCASPVVHIVDMGSAPGSGFARSSVGRRPYQGQSPVSFHSAPARHSLAAHPAAKPLEPLFRQNIFRRWTRSIVSTLAVLLSVQMSLLYAQTGPTDGTTPSAITPGAPAGSYALSDLDSINPYNGVLSFRVPLLTIAGRGTAQTTMAVQIQPESWIVRESRDGNLFPDRDWWTGLKPGYGPGVLQGRPVGTESNQQCPQTGQLTYFETLTRLTFTTSDGTEFELRDQLTGGRPGGTPMPCTVGTSRGTVFVTSDGSAATFISDSVIRDNTDKLGPRIIHPSGRLMLRDGTRYRIDNGLVSWIRDSNGNQLTFFYDGDKRVRTIIDSLNRVVTITYGDRETVFFDRISFKGFQGETREILVSYKRLSQILRNDYPPPVKRYIDLFTLGGSNNELYNPLLVSSIDLPDSRNYQFRYNYYGELARVKLPSGGAIEYDPMPGNGVVERATFAQIFRRVAERRVYPNGDNGPNFESRVTYSNSSTPAVVDFYDHNNTLVTRRRHYYFGNPGDSLFRDPLQYAGWKEGKEFRTEIMAQNGNDVLHRIERTWAQKEAVRWWNGAADAEPANDPRVIETTVTLVETNQVAKSSSVDPKDGSIGFDQFNNQTDVWEYDYGNGTPGELIKHTQTDFLTVNPITTENYISDQVHLLELPLRVSVFDGAGVEKARMTYEYDNYVTGLVNRPGICSHDGQKFDSNYRNRGNVTKTTNWLLPDRQISSTSAYDIAGNVVSVTDALNRTTSFDFSDKFGEPDGNARGSEQSPAEIAGLSTYAFVTKATNPLGHVVFLQADYFTGKPVDSEDANGIVTSIFYADALDRPTKLIRAAGTATANQTRYIYNDSSRLITTRSDLNELGDGLLEVQLTYDGLGRTVVTGQVAPEGVIKKVVTYDALSRVKTVSNPHVSTGEATYGLQQITYDPLSRIIRTETFNGAGASTGALLTDYFGTASTSTDQAGKKRRRTTDGLGRTVQLDELNEDGSPYTATSYEYDALSNLVHVIQGGQHRYFMYDSLSRLIFSRNPEQQINAGLIATDSVTGNSEWTSQLIYDDGDNVKEKIDARGVRGLYDYDALDRPVRKTYQGGSVVTPTVNYFYDNQQLPAGAPTFTRGASLGKLVAQTFGGTANGTYYALDTIGRVTESFQTTDAVSYRMGYSYNLAGNITTETYPSGKVYQTQFDASGRIREVARVNAVTQSPEKVFVTQLVYTAHGAMRSMTLGNNTVETMDFNSRLQPAKIELRKGSNTELILGLDLNYGTTANNGNLLSQTIRIGHQGTVTSINQLYDYDEVNRLKSASETSWRQDYGYDRFGNRWLLPSSTGYPVDARLTPSRQEDINGNSNRLQMAGMTYDEAGNLKTQPRNGLNDVMDYDAENRMTSHSSSGVLSTYLYDGSGRRIKKAVGNAVTVFVYNLSGRLIAEYTSNPASGSGTTFLTVDQLGSARVETDSNGAVKGRRDYLPFGEELGAGFGGRQVSMGYDQDNGLRQKFTGQERDVESGLDYFDARYYSGPQGRFTGADPLMSSATTDNPQTWNRFTYVINNPLRYVDPDGQQPKDAWSQLTPEEQRLIASKIKRDKVKLKNGKERLETAQEAFNRIVGDITQGNTALVPEVIAGFKNFLDNIGAHTNSKAWQQIKVLQGGWMEMTSPHAVSFKIEVKDKNKFLTALRQSGLFEVDHKLDDYNAHGNHNHSVRYITERSWHPSMHITQDEGQTGGNFFVHWDRMSVMFTKEALPGSRVAEIGVAAADHILGGRISATDLRDRLRNLGVVPEEKTKKKK